MILVGDASGAVDNLKHHPVVEIRRLSKHFSDNMEFIRTACSWIQPRNAKTLAMGIQSVLGAVELVRVLKQTPIDEWFTVCLVSAFGKLKST